MTDSLFQKVPWWAVSAVFHVVLVVELMGFGILLPLAGEETPEVGLTRGEDTILSMEVSRLPEIGPAPAEIPPLPVVDTSFHIPEGEGGGNETADDEIIFRRDVGSWDAALDPARLKRLASARVPSMAGDRSATPSTGAIHEALQWLAREQRADGSWGDTGVTALAVLAFLECGASSRAACRRGLDALVAQQDPEGCIGPRSAAKYMYGHLVATRALCLVPEAREAARRAVEFTLAAQNPGKGWRYSFRCGDNDSMVTGFAVLALREAQRAGIHVPRASWDGIRAWYDEVTDTAYSLVGYTDRGSKCCIPSRFERFDHHLTRTALGIVARTILDPSAADPRIAAGWQMLRRDSPVWTDSSADFTYWYCAALAFREILGSTGKFWPEWRAKTLDVLLPNQNLSRDPRLRGSWDPVDRWSEEGGRVYATAMNALTLAACAAK